MSHAFRTAGVILAGGLAFASLAATPAFAAPTDDTETASDAALAASEAAEAAGNGNGTFKFGLITDIQYADQATPAGSTRYYRDALPKLANAVDDLNQRNLSFTVHMGDIIDGKAKSFDEILPIFNRFSMPTKNLLGNHEFADTGMFSGDVVKKLGMPKQYYDWTQGGYRFVALDTTRISTFANPKGSPEYNEAVKTIANLKAQGAPNAQEWDGGVGTVQLNWLRGVLADAKAKHQKVLVFGHAPVMGVNQHNAFDSDKIRATFEKAGNVVAYFCGHDHMGRYEVVNGIHYLNMKGFVEQPYPTTQYAVVTVKPNKVEVDGIGREADRTIPVSNAVKKAIR